MRRTATTIGMAIALLATSSAAAPAQQPASAEASCLGVLVSYEASQLAPGALGAETSGLARSGPGLGRALVSSLAHQHLGSIETCVEAAG
jgi:hypothetical protein